MRGARHQNSWIKCLLLLQFAVLSIYGVKAAWHFRIWSPVDEAHHFSFIQFLHENRRLPVYGQDHIGPEIVEISRGNFPKNNLSWVQLSDKSNDLEYTGESFQPPLYYFLSLPFYSITHDFFFKIFYLRLWDLFLLFASIGVAWRTICELQWKDRLNPLLALAWVMNFSLIPHVLIRAVTISNHSLEIFIITSLFYCLVKGLRDKKITFLVISSITCGLAFLTKLTSLYAYPILLLSLIYRQLSLRTLRKTPLLEHLKVSFLAILPILMIFPWLLFNHQNYGKWTANSLARIQQAPWVNPGLHVYSLSDHLAILGTYFNPFIPPEFWRFTVPPFYAFCGQVMKFIFFILAPILAIAACLRKKEKLPVEVLVLLIGLIGVFSLCVVTTWRENWPMANRYLFSSWPAWFVGCSYILSRNVSLKLFLILDWLGFLTVFIYWDRFPIY